MFVLCNVQICLCVFIWLVHVHVCLFLSPFMESTGIVFSFLGKYAYKLDLKTLLPHQSILMYIEYY